MKLSQKQDGFTLIELVIVIVLLAIIARVASQILAQGFQGMIESQNVTNVNWQGQVALERLSRDLAMVRSTADISVNTATEFSFVDVLGATHDYKISGSSLLLNSQVLADGVSALNFTYYDKSGTSGAALANLSYVGVALTFNQKNINYTLNTAIFLRNLSI